MSVRARTVTRIMTEAWALIVRRAWVPFSDDFHQSQNPVRAANTETMAPPRNTNVPARKKSRDHSSSLPTRAITSNAAARM